MKAIRIGILGALLLVSLVSVPVNAQTTVTCAQDYTVASGDWLSKIGEKYFTSVTAYHAIATQTNLKSETDFSYATVVNPDSIEVGWKLCIPTADAAKALNGDNAPEGLSKTALGNATYTSNIGPDDTATLQDGEFSEPAAPDTPLMTQVTLTDQIAYGDLNGVPSAAVIIGATGGGSGYFYSLHIMQNQDGKPTEVATTGLGDRSPVIALAVQDNQILVDIITQGPDQPMCCGNLRVLTWFKLDGNQLTVATDKSLGNLGPNGETPGSFTPTPPPTEPANGTPVPSETPSAPVEATPTQTPTSAATEAPTAAASETPTASASETATADATTTTGASELTGIVWKWQGTTASSGDVTAADPSKYTVFFQRGGTALIQADCNSASGGYTVSEQALTFAPIVTTLVACPEGSQGSEFLQQLQAAATYSFEEGNLRLVLAADGGTMKFTK